MHKNCHSGEPKEGEIVIVKEDDEQLENSGKIMCLISGRNSKFDQLPSKNTAVNYLYPLQLQLQVGEKSNEDAAVITTWLKQMGKNQEMTLQSVRLLVNLDIEKHFWKLNKP